MQWATTARPHVDRCATAWLIRGFVDPDATFTFLAPGEPAPEGATPFDLPGAEHGHKGKACTFETVLRKYGHAKDPGLRYVAEVVHDIDFHAMKLRESAGLDRVLRGLLLAEPDDALVLQKSAALFDALAAWGREGGGKAR